MQELDALIEEIEAEVRATSRWTGRASLDPRVLAAMRAVRRDLFVPQAEARRALDNMALPIGHGQTISQPMIVALMTDLLRPEPDHVVLEVGTGSGYQAAVLARLVRRVFSIETIPVLAERAREVLAATGVGNVELRVGDGARGWPEHAPFDGVIVTAAAREVPPALVDQLRAPGRMVIPVGPPHGEQELRLIEKDADGKLHKRAVLDVAFVPLVETGAA